MEILKLKGTAEYNFNKILGAEKNKRLDNINLYLDKIHQNINGNKDSMVKIQNEFYQIKIKFGEFLSKNNGVSEILSYSNVSERELMILIRELRIEQKRIIDLSYSALKNLEEEKDLSKYYQEIEENLNLINKKQSKNFLEIENGIEIIELRVNKLENAYFAINERLNGNYGSDIQFLSVSINSFNNEDEVHNIYYFQYERFFEYTSRSNWRKNLSALFEIGRFDWEVHKLYKTIPSLTARTFIEDNSFNYVALGAKYRCFSR
jgi:hypothetical protein